MTKSIINEFKQKSPLFSTNQGLAVYINLTLPDIVATFHARSPFRCGFHLNYHHPMSYNYVMKRTVSVSQCLADILDQFILARVFRGELG